MSIDLIALVDVSGTKRSLMLLMRRAKLYREDEVFYAYTHTYVCKRRYTHVLLRRPRYQLRLGNEFARAKLELES